MDIRYTQQMQAAQAVNYMETQSTQLATAENQISSGVSLQQPSDNPTDFVTVMSEKAQDLNYTTYLSNVSSATTQLNSGVSALTSAQTFITQAEQIAQQGANAATDTNGLPALASQANSLINSLLTVANTQVNGNYIFGGTASNTQPFTVTAQDSSGNATAVGYQGSNEQSQMLIGPGQTVNTTYAGSSIFQQSGGDVFQALIAMRNDLQNPNLSQSTLSQDMNQQLSVLQQASTNVGNAVGEQSASLQNLSALQSRMQELQTSNQETMSNLKNTDYASAIVNLNEVQNVFQATLESSAKIFSLNLFSYIQ